MKHIWSVLCQRSVVDSQSNNISLIDVLERLEVTAPTDLPGFPKGRNIKLPMQYELVNFWIRTKEDKEEKANIRIVLTDPNGKELNRIDKELILPSDKRRIREINKIQGITLTKSGIYSFVVSIRQDGDDKYKKVVELPLEVQISKNLNDNPQLN